MLSVDMTEQNTQRSGRVLSFLRFLFRAITIVVFMTVFLQFHCRKLKMLLMLHYILCIEQYHMKKSEHQDITKETQFTEIQFGSISMDHISDIRTADYSEYGIKLHGSPDLNSNVTFMMKLQMSGNFQLPPDITLVSAVYSIETSGPLNGLVTVEIDHFVSIQCEQDVRALCFLRSPGHSFEFEPLVGGRFKAGSRWGIIALSSFSSLAIGFNNSMVDHEPRLIFRAEVQYKRVDSKYHMELLAGRDLKVFKKVSCSYTFLVTHN